MYGTVLSVTAGYLSCHAALTGRGTTALRRRGRGSRVGVESCEDPGMWLSVGEDAPSRVSERVGRWVAALSTLCERALHLRDVCSLSEDGVAAYDATGAETRVGLPCAPAPFERAVPLQLWVDGELTAVHVPSLLASPSVVPSAVAARRAPTGRGRSSRHGSGRIASR